jgi:hypothetical protein
MKQQNTELVVSVSTGATTEYVTMVAQPPGDQTPHLSGDESREKDKEATEIG